MPAWSEVGRIVLSGVLAFAALLALIRIVGNRTIATMNASDFVLTVALGSTLSTIIVSREVSIGAGAVALAVLVGLQAATLWLSIRFPRLRQATQGEPVLLIWKGQMLIERARQHFVSETEIRQAVRQQGIGDIGRVRALFLEADGHFSVIGEQQAGGMSAAPRPRPQPARDQNP